VEYSVYEWDELRNGVALEPPEGAVRAYLLAEGGIVRYLVGDRGEVPDVMYGMPLIPDFPEEFDTDLQYIRLRSAAQDVRLHVYYYRSA
jgi:hypothetical protein